MNELLPRKRKSSTGIGIAAVVVIALVVAGFLVPGYLAKRKERALAEALAAADLTRLEGLDHSGLLRHAADPLVALDRHRYPACRRAL